MSNISDLIYESRISNLEDALNLALCYLSKFEPGDSRAVSDEFVAMAAIHADSGRDYNGDCMPIIDKALENVRQQNMRDEFYGNVYVTVSETPDETKV